jgi:glycosyltransferase A (GT-A) superfamily protein (DUF2064 family)
MKKKKLLLLFSKWPKKGYSKLRMAKGIGEENIEKFCFACLDDIIQKTRNLEETDFIVVPNTIEESSLFKNKYGVLSISLEHLGIFPDSTMSEILQGLFSYFLGEYKKVNLIPMDVPHINIKTIEESFEKLDHCNQVFGPERNGGIYLIGLNKLSRYAFDRVRWSTENSFNDLIRNSRNPVTLEYSFDLNVPTDLANLDSTTLATCPHLTRFIKSLMLERIIMRREAMVI